MVKSVNTGEFEVDLEVGEGQVKAQSLNKCRFVEFDYLYDVGDSVGFGGFLDSFASSGSVGDVDEGCSHFDSLCFCQNYHYSSCYSNSEPASQKYLILCC